MDRTSGLRSPLLLLLLLAPPTRRGPFRHVNWWLPLDARRIVNGEPGRLKLAFINTTENVRNGQEMGNLNSENLYFAHPAVDPHPRVADVAAAQQRIDVVRLDAHLFADAVIAVGSSAVAAVAARPSRQ